MKQLRAKLYMLSAAFVSCVATVVCFLVFGSNSLAQSEQPKKGQMVLTSTLSIAARPGRVIYRYEDREYGIVCYASQEDLSDPIGCTKK